MYHPHHNYPRPIPRRQNPKLRASYGVPVNLQCRPSTGMHFRNSQMSNTFSKPQIPIGKEVREVKMVHSPEVKINLDSVEQPPVYYQKSINSLNLFQQQSQRCSYETLRTASTSTESLLSANNQTTNISIINPNTMSPMTPMGMNNLVRSQENLLCQPFGMDMNMCNNEYFHKRKISMSNLMTPNPFNLNNMNGLNPAIPNGLYEGRFTQSNKKSSKCYYNKFNSPSENSNNENTVILTLKIKIAKDEYRVFNLKKFDDLFISLQKFFDLNQIKQDLIKPIVSKIFNALNKIFYLMNNKIGLYDQEYLSSLYNLWKKNNGKIPNIRSRNEPKTEKKNKSFTDGYEEKNKKKMNSSC